MSDYAKRDQPNLFTIPPGVPFLSTFATHLLQGKLFENFSYDSQNPHLLSRCRIYVPTRRAARALRSEFADQIGRGSIILPEIKALGETEEDLGFFDAGTDADFSIKEPISKIQSTLILGELILAWKQALPKVFSEQLQSVPLVAPASPADALWLADELLSLIESAESEEVDLELIDNIELDDHAKWWQLTLEFIKIARQYWPNRLVELNLQSSARHQVEMLDRQTKELELNGFDGPIIVAGSTGSLPATARLIKTVSQMPNGAVVLPGLDQQMTAEQWSYIFNYASDAMKQEALDHLTSIVTQGHPQFGLARLLSRIGLQVQDFPNVHQLGSLDQDLKLRLSIVSQAMLPAALTDSWSATKTHDLAKEAKAFETVTLINAANDREEAAAIGVAIRLALEPHDEVINPTVALVTPDRNLAKRVSIELQKYGIDADDSGGLSLVQTDLGSLTKLILEVVFGQGDNSILAALLKHPFSKFGFEKSTRLTAISTIERILLRGSIKTHLPDQLPEAFANYLAQVDTQKHVPMWRRNITEDEIKVTGEFIAKLAEVFSNFRQTDDGIEIDAGSVLSIHVWTKKTIEALEQITSSEDKDFSLWDSEAGSQLVSLLQEVVACPTSLAVTGPEWLTMLEPLLNGQVVKPNTGRHPQVMIWGALEARLQDVDTLILAALNEGTWPSTSSNDPFLSRSMKSEIGLEPPERRIGLAAHDFQIGMGTRRVVLSRALKSGGAPTVSSRWVQRLFAVLDPSTSAEIVKRGAQYISYAALSPQKTAIGIGQRPEPKPDKKFQPNSYSFSEISTLRRDPYAIYAKKVLKLQSLEDFSAEPDLRVRGTIYHAILEEFSTKINLDNHQSWDVMIRDIVDSEFEKNKIDVDLALLWKHRFMQVAPTLISWEFDRNDELKSRHVELSAKCKLPIVDNVQLTGRADRIDIMNNGMVEIIDFKTGNSPSAKEARSLLDPQLPLEVYAMEHDGFPDLGQFEVQSMKYVRLKPSETLTVDQVESKPTKKEPEPPNASQLGEKAAKELGELLAALQDKKIGFRSRAIPKMQRDYSGDYDHLARVSEWSVADSSEVDDDHG